MFRYSLLAFAILISACASLPAAEEENSTVTARTLRVADGFYRDDVFRRVADDDTDSGYSVLLSTSYLKTPGQLANNSDFRPAVNSYLRNIMPGEYRIVFRLKLSEIPSQPVKIFSWDVNTTSSGLLGSGSIETSAFNAPGIYQDIVIRAVVPQGVDLIEPRLYWHGGANVWVDTITIYNAKSPAPYISGAGLAAKTDGLASSAEARPAEIRAPLIQSVTKNMYFETANIFFGDIARTTEYWLKQPRPYPNMSEYVEYIKWHAYAYLLTGNQAFARTAANSIGQANQLLLLPQKQDENIQPKWQEVAPLYFIDKWLGSSPAYTYAHRAWVRGIALRAVPSFPDVSMEYGASNRAFLFAITGEALLRLIPNAPDAVKWQKYKDEIWNNWWRYRDMDENAEHYNALWFSYLLQWVQMRDFEQQFWSDNRVKQLFERFLYQVFPMGSLPHYSDSLGWNVSWGHWVYLFETCATRFNDGRFKWAAHRIYEYGIGRIEKITSWTSTGREAGWSLMQASAVADDRISEMPRESDIALLMRHRVVQRSEVVRKATNQYFDLTTEMAPDKLVFYGGSERDALSMMIDVTGAAGHGHARPSAIVALADHQSVLLMSLGYLERHTDHHNISTLADYGGYHYDNTPYHIKSENNIVKSASAVDMGKAGYGNIYVENYEGYPAALIREIVFIKNAGILIKDTLLPRSALRVRWSPGFRVRNVGSEFGINWINTYLGEWVPVRGLQQNKQALARWRNNPRNLLIYFLPDPTGKLETIDERSRDQNLPLPLRVQYSMRQSLIPYRPTSVITLLVPHGKDSATTLARDVRVILNKPHQFVVEFRDDDGIDNLVVLNSSGLPLKTDNMSTDAVVACIRHRGNEIISTSMSKGTTLMFSGLELARNAPPPISNIIPSPY